MNKCLKIISLFTNSATYLPIKALIPFSHINDYINKTLDPEKNAYIHFIVLEQVMLDFQQYDSDNNSQNKKDVLQKYISFLEEINDSIKAYMNQKIKNKVLISFKIHMYLPDLRKENNHLEYESSSINKIFNYSIKKYFY